MPPPQLCASAKEGSAPQWDDAAIRAALNLFLSILPLGHSLINTLAVVYAKSSNDIKRVLCLLNFEVFVMALFISCF